MNPQDAIDFGREAIKTCMMIGGPILVASLVVGLLVGAFQAMTQVQDQTVSFVPKILLLILTISLMLPWCTDHLLDFAKLSFEKPMPQWSDTPIVNSVDVPEDKAANDLLAPQVRVAQVNSSITSSQNASLTSFGNAPSNLKRSFSMPQMRTGTSSQTQNAGDSFQKTPTTMPTFKPRSEFNFGLPPEKVKTRSPFQVPNFRDSNTRISNSPRNDLDG